MIQYLLIFAYFANAFDSNVELDESKTNHVCGGVKVVYNEQCCGNGDDAPIVFPLLEECENVLFVSDITISGVGNESYRDQSQTWMTSALASYIELSLPEYAMYAQLIAPLMAAALAAPLNASWNGDSLALAQLSLEAVVTTSLSGRRLEEDNVLLGAGTLYSATLVTGDKLVYVTEDVVSNFIKSSNTSLAFRAALLPYFSSGNVNIIHGAQSEQFINAVVLPKLASDQAEWNGVSNSSLSVSVSSTKVLDAKCVSTRYYTPNE